MPTWAAHPADTVTARLWPDAEHLPAELVTRLLAAAQESCEAYAPALADTDTVPDRYTVAVCLHARDVWNASRRSPEGTLGPEDYAYQVRPLSLDVRQLLRPRDPRPRFGGAA